MYTQRLQTPYDGFEDFKHYAEIYGLDTRLGFASPQEAWDANPVVTGSTNPADFRIATHQPFKCFGVSENTNDFGLHEVRLMDENGIFFTAAAGKINCPQRGQVLQVPLLPSGEPHFGTLGFEIPEKQTPDAPQEIIDDVWDIEPD